MGMEKRERRPVSGCPLACVEINARSDKTAKQAKIESNCNNSYNILHNYWISSGFSLGGAWVHYLYH